jgi:hypothetical protein
VSRSSTLGSPLRVLERLDLLTGKIGKRVAMSLLMCVPMCEALLLMNTKDLVELVMLNISHNHKVLNEEAFAILVLMGVWVELDDNLGVGAGPQENDARWSSWWRRSGQVKELGGQRRGGRHQGMLRERGDRKMMEGKASGWVRLIF